MDAEAIVNGWLVLGHSGRSPEQRTRLGRVPAGSKGLGRLAALRLGSTALLRSRPAENDENIVCEFNGRTTPKPWSSKRYL
jgi:hypothetical protein